MKQPNRLVEKFVGKRSELPLEYRFFNILALMGISFSFYATILNIILKLHISIIIAPLLMGIFSLILYRVTYITKKYSQSTTIILMLTSLIFYPLMWILNGGSKGAIPLFFVLQAGMIAVFIGRIGKQINLWLFVLMICSLLVLEYKFPDIILGYETELTRFLDFGVSLPLICFGIFFMISIIMKEYNHNIEELKTIQIKLKEANELLKTASITDELSGVFNRRYIMSSLRDAVESNETSSEVSVIMFDIDHFKNVNDTYGHCVGDRVIQNVCEVFKNNIRNSDIIGRIGGEEFLMILPNVNIKDAYNRAEQIRKSISELEWSFKDMTITVSGGVYTKEESESIEDMLEKVDKSLYKAKNTGRNLVMV